ncbi:MAG: hypothetical protein K8S55_00790 [Phycisphaerae bacterium]|nr:hypothetical protein [Phycisphaerae bacterium]
MEPVYLRTQLPISECQRRLEDRVGKPRWRLFVDVTSLGFGRYCQKPLQGTVKPDGFDVAETRDGGAENPLVRGRWATLEGATIIRLQPYGTWGFWAGHIFAGIVCGGVLTVIAVAIAGSMSGLAAGAYLLGFSAMCIAVMLWHHSRRLSSLGRELTQRFAVFFEAETIEDSEGRLLDMHFGV